jgi:hypothetical protein
LSGRVSENIEGTGGMYFFLLGAIGLLLTSTDAIGVAVASTTTNDATIQDPGEISAMMTQASK